MANHQTFTAVIALALVAAGNPLLANANGKLSMSVMALAKQCAPNVAPETVGYVVSHESRNNPFAVHVNGVPWSKQPKTETFEDAKGVVEKLAREGASFDTGYGQIWSGNLAALGVSAVDMLEPCKNLAALDRILSDCYRAAVVTNQDGQAALRNALSCYNTGNQRDGYTNGYVGKVLAVAQANNTMKVPALRVDGVESEGGQVGSSVGQENALPAENARLGRSDGFDDSTPDGFANSTQDGFEVMARQHDGAPNEGLSHPAKTIRGNVQQEEINTDMDSEVGRKEMASTL